MLHNLSNWVNDFGHGYNWVRIKDRNFIGLNCNIGDIIASSLYYQTAIRRDLIWVVFGGGELERYANLYNDSYNYPKYNFSDLESAKDNIDKFLISIVKLEVFT